MAFELSASHFHAILNSQFRLDRLMPALLDIILEATGADRGFVMLCEENDELSIKAARGREHNDLNAEHFQGSTSITGKVLQEKKPVYVPFLPLSASFSSSVSARAQNLQSVICIPLWRSRQSENPELLGLLYIDSSNRIHPLEEEHMQQMEGLTNFVAVSIENAQLFAEVEAKNREIASLNAQLQQRVEMQAGKLVEMEILLEDSQRELGRKYALGNLVGKSTAMLKVFKILEKVVGTTATVLIQGESGTGKELVAKHIHYNGPRAKRPMVSINCAAFNDTLLESELFGHRKGAFTGADQHKMGVFQLADGGSLFLDEVGDMSLDMQKKLLRVLQDGEVRPVGSQDTSHVDVRIIAASNRMLKDLMQENKFREDLYFRLNVIQVQLPPLRERREDIPLLIDFYSRRIAEELHRSARKVPDKILERFLDYDWPGNVRELENELRRVFILESEYRFEALPSAPAADEGDLNLNSMEKRTIERALTQTGGNKTKAAEKLGIPLRTFYEKLKKYSIGN